MEVKNIDINNLFSLKNKNILITGATGHLGESMALGLAKAGANVLINSRSQKNCEQIANKIIKKNYKAEPASFDITNEKAIRNYSTEKLKLPLHCLVNNAYSGNGGTIKSSSSDSYFKSYNLNVVSVHNLTVHLLNNLRLAVKKTGDASIINISSMYGLVSPDMRIYKSHKNTNPPFYGASKAALIQWTKYAACEFGLEKIRVNSITPGAFPSNSFQKKSPNIINNLKKKIPLARIGHPEELNGLLILLSSEASSYITGANIEIDGGYTCW